MVGHSFSAALVLKATYGYSIEKSLAQPDPLVTEAEDTVKMMAQAIQPGRWLVDTLPFCKCLHSLLYPYHQRLLTKNS